MDGAKALTAMAVNEPKIARQLRAKLNATNRAQTVAIALRQNLIR